MVGSLNDPEVDRDKGGTEVMRIIQATIGFVAFVLAPLSIGQAQDVAKPNILVIFGDDIG